MKTNKIFIVSIILSTILSLQSCTKDFVEMNTNPNGVSSAAPESLIGPAIENILTTNLNRNFRINNELMQVTVTLNDNLEIHRYEIRPSEAEATWRTWYTELTNVRDIYRQASGSLQKGYQTYQGISLILDAWLSSLITDMYGDVPYFGSNQGYQELNTTPPFDHQEEIYKDILRKLEEANTLLKANETVTFPTNDPIYHTDPVKWRKFGNSLYLRLLLRIAHMPESNAVAKIKEIIDTNADEYPIMQGNDDSAVLYYTNIEPYINPNYTARDIDFNGGRGYSEFFINNLLDLNDPRLPIWSTEASLGVYTGMQSQYIRGSVPDRQSTLKTTLKADGRMGNIMNYAELQFILAECAVRGYTSQEANLFYKKGVNASMEFWGVTTPDTYFNNSGASFSESDPSITKLKKIHLQKYFALIFTDFQQWYEYRRTQLLDLYTGPGVENNGKMPVRLNYPVIVQSLNNANYTEAVNRMGGDGINERMWWQPSIN